VTKRTHTLRETFSTGLILVVRVRKKVHHIRGHTHKERETLEHIPLTSSGVLVFYSKELSLREVWKEMKQLSSLQFLPGGYNHGYYEYNIKINLNRSLSQEIYQNSSSPSFQASDFGHIKSLLNLNFLFCQEGLIAMSFP
jgi:hypothetical protein